MQALSALTPPLVVGAVVIIAIIAFLRHEMRRSRAGRSAPGDESDVPAMPKSGDPDNERRNLADASRAQTEDRTQGRDR